MTIMKTRLINLLTLLFMAFPAGAEIYKTTDKHGNVVFTDRPPISGPREEVILKAPTEIPSLAPRQTTPRIDLIPEMPEVVYDQFEISSPANDSTVRNSGNFQIKLAIRPDLARTHRVRFLIDGEAVSGPKRSLLHSVTNMDRGTHQLKAELLDQAGNVLESASSTVHVRRTIFRPPSGN